MGFTSVASLIGLDEDVCEGLGLGESSTSTAASSASSASSGLSAGTAGAGSATTTSSEQTDGSDLHKKNAATLEASGITISSTGKCASAYNKSCTSLDGMQQVALDGAANLAETIGAFRMTAGTECGHAGWACGATRPTATACSGVDSHACGAKFDVGVGGSDDAAIANTIQTILENSGQDGVTSGGYAVYRGVQIGGCTYDIIDERQGDGGAHYDFAPQGCGG